MDSHRLGETLKLWFGIVENNDDKEKSLGRVKVRIIGFHTPQKSKLPTEKLPWAIVMNPTNNPAVNGKGETANKLEAGSMVCGFFLDGDDCQQPIVIGTLFSKIVDDTIRASKPIPDTVADFQNPGAYFIESERLSEFEPSTDKEFAAEATPFSIANPNGEGITSTANGKDGSGNTVFGDISITIQEFGNNIKHAEVVNTEPKTIQGNVGKEDNFILADITTDTPRSGLFSTNKGEYIACTGYNDKGLTGCIRGCYNTEPQTYEPGDQLSYIENELNDTPKEIRSTITGKIIDFRKEVDRIIKKIRNYIKWLVNIIKSTLTSLVSDAIVRLGRFLKSLFPFQTKVIIEALYQVLKQIECNFGEAFINGIINKIKGIVENFANELINKILNGVTDIIDEVTGCVKNIFDSVTSISLFIEDVLNMIDSAVSLVSKANTAANLSTTTGNLRNNLSKFSTGAVAGGASGVSGIGGSGIGGSFNASAGTGNGIGGSFNATGGGAAGGIGGGGGNSGAGAGGVNSIKETQEFINTVNNIGNTVGLLLDLLGIGCNKSTSPPETDFFTTYNNELTANCAEFLRDANIVDANVKTYNSFSCANIVKELNIKEVLSQYRRPIKALQKIISQGEKFKEEFDNTPGAEAYSRYMPGGTSERVFDAGTKVETINGDRFQVVVDNDHVRIRGNCYVTVDGDYHLKVNGNYHLDVVGEYNVHVGSESQQTFCGEHSTFYKNSAKVNAQSGYSLTGSKIGLSAAGNLDLYTQGACTLIGGEANWATTGSFNIACLQYNKAVLFNNFSTVVNNSVSLVGLNGADICGNTSSTLAGVNLLDFSGASKISTQGGSNTTITGGISIRNTTGAEAIYSSNRLSATPGIQIRTSSSIQHYNALAHVFT